jgi:hypothetical protein
MLYMVNIMLNAAYWTYGAYNVVYVIYCLHAELYNICYIFALSHRASGQCRRPSASGATVFDFFAPAGQQK